MGWTRIERKLRVNDYLILLAHNMHGIAYIYIGASKEISKHVHSTLLDYGKMINKDP